MADDNTSNDCSFGQVYVPSRMEKFWRYVGYRHHHTESTEEADLMPGWAKTHIGFQFDFILLLRKTSSFRAGI
jgi:hypothetical protein